MWGRSGWWGAEFIKRAVSQDSRLKWHVSVPASAPTSLPDSTAVGTRVYEN